MSYSEGTATKPVHAFSFSCYGSAMRRPAKLPAPPLDIPTLTFAIQLLEERFRAVETYGAGGCPTCHDAELRAAIARLRELSAVTPP